jgi:hypothetical protein
MSVKIGELKEEMEKMKSHFPFKIIFAIETDEKDSFNVYARNTRHLINSAIKQGLRVFTLS